MWGTTLIIDRMGPQVSPTELREKEEDQLVLTWEQRRWMRGRYTTAKGRKIGIALPTGTPLVPGAILYIASDWFLKIEASVELVLEASPAGYESALKIAFEVGNLHFPLALEDGKILVPDDKTMTRLMDRLGVSWERRQVMFNPIGNTQLHQHGPLS